MDLQAAKEIIHIISGGIGRNVAPLLNDRDKPFQVAGNVIHICLSDVWPALLQFVEKFIPMFLQDIFVSHVLLDETKRRMHLALRLRAFASRQSSSLYSSGTSSAGTSRVCTSP